MIQKMRTYFAIGVLLIASSCGEYQKIVKSTDYEYKLKKAREYYDKKDYNRASQLYAELVNIFRGTNRSDQVYYYLAKSNFGQHDYMMAGHYFRQLVKEFPRSTSTSNPLLSSPPALSDQYRPAYLCIHSPYPLYIYPVFQVRWLEH